ncbi:hypothetical protein G210_5594 [Candida maltosa Xu316]|uniref:Uncharacterized protein n=1 Tax=Candida maltosa (strain Xu316) TaxID=1245528 RepID=M3JBW2_CANMX|nr:hypothetical protein G210_5594 [Candida maltosa Xu316]
MFVTFVNYWHGISFCTPIIPVRDVQNYECGT